MKGRDNMAAAKKCIVKQLPSGFWAICPWPGKDWIDAASKDKNQVYTKAFDMGYDVIAAFTGSGSEARP
jgi:hypothetical protein